MTSKMPSVWMRSRSFFSCATQSATEKGPAPQIAHSQGLRRSARTALAASQPSLPSLPFISSRQHHQNHHQYQHHLQHHHQYQYQHTTTSTASSTSTRDPTIPVCGETGTLYIRDTSTYNRNTELLLGDVDDEDASEGCCVDTRPLVAELAFSAPTTNPSNLVLPTHRWYLNSRAIVFREQWHLEFGSSLCLLQTMLQGGLKLPRS